MRLSPPAGGDGGGDPGGAHGELRGQRGQPDAGGGARLRGVRWPFVPAAQPHGSG